MPDNFTEWDLIETLHTRHAEEFPETQVSVSAIRRIRSILEPHWRIARFNQYPLAYILCVAPHTKELTHLANKLELVKQIPGSERRIQRLGSLRDFSAAWHEIDFAFKLHLDGWECEFVEQGPTPSPDLLAEKDSRLLEVEVTSLNRPREEELVSTMASTIMVVGLQTRCAVGGIAYISNRLSPVVVSRFEKQLREAANKAQTEATCISVNEPGLWSMQTAAWESAHLMDPRWKGSWRFESTPPLPKERRLDSTLREKVERQLSADKPGLVVVYDSLLTDEEEKQIARHNLSVQVGTYPHLSAVALIRPRIWTDPFQAEVREDETLVYGRHSLCDREAESFIVWRNMMKPKAADPIVSTITNFPSNLERFHSN